MLLFGKKARACQLCGGKKYQICARFLFFFHFVFPYVCNNSEVLHMSLQSHWFGTALLSWLKQGKVSWSGHKAPMPSVHSVLSLATHAALGYLSNLLQILPHRKPVSIYTPYSSPPPPPMNHFPCTISRFCAYFNILKPSICIVFTRLSLLLVCEPLQRIDVILPVSLCSVVNGVEQGPNKRIPN